MFYTYFRAHWALFTAPLLVSVHTILAQAPVITSVIPANNAQVPRNTPVTVTFSQQLTPASAGALKVFSSRRGGQRARGATPAIVNGTDLSFAPTAYPFLPGETVQYTVTTVAAGTGGPLPMARVGHFTAAVGGTGNGNFQLASTPGVGSQPTRVLLADVDGDGDLDLVNNLINDALINIGLNNGSGVFSGGGGSISQYLAIPNPANSLVVGDVDGDGDLDLIAANVSFSGNSGAVSVRLNDGSGIFSGGQDIAINNPYNLALGDVDGDGDLDIAVNNGTSGLTPVSILLNNGNGTFSNGQQVAIRGGGGLALGDLDNDGDLDMMATGTYMSVRMNSGNGTFAGGSDSPASYPFTTLLLGDLDSDNDLDLVAADYNGAVLTLLNTGNGTFSGASNTFLGGGYTGTISGGLTSIALGDVDGDGDLDLTGTSTYFTSTGQPPGKVGLRLNNGNGTFSGGSNVDVVFSPQNVTMGDVDGDGDLDLLVVSATTNPGRATVLLNQPGLVTAVLPTRAASTFTIFPSPAHDKFTITGVAPNAPLILLDALGRALFTATADANGTAWLALPGGLPAGIYLVRSGEQIRRMIVE